MNIKRRLANNNAYQRLYVRRHLDALLKDMSDAEFRLWEFYADISGWDSRYEDTYQIVSSTDKEVAENIGWSEAKVSRVRNGLIQKEFIKKIRRGRYFLHLNPVKYNETKMDDKVAKTKDKLIYKNNKLADLF